MTLNPDPRAADGPPATAAGSPRDVPRPAYARAATPPAGSLLLMSLAARRLAVAPAALDALAAQLSTDVVLPPGAPVVAADRPATSLHLLLDGVAARPIVGRDGARQLVALHLPGDFVDLDAIAGECPSGDVVALTPCRVASTPRSRIDAVTGEHPALARALWSLAMIESAAQRTWLFRIARLEAAACLAGLLCEMHLRLLAVGRAEPERFALRLNQGLLGELCGLTNVHVSRVLRGMREAGLCTVRGGSVELHDRRRLAALAQFDPTPMHLDAALLVRAEEAAVSVAAVPSAPGRGASPGPVSSNPPRWRPKSLAFVL